VYKRQSTISTQAIIDENQALVIGGYQSQSNNRFQQKVPVLGDIPFFGKLFTTTQNNDANKERLFVIVPRAIARRYNSQTMQADYINPNTDTGMPSSTMNNEGSAVRLGENIGGGQILPKRNNNGSGNSNTNFDSPARPPINLPANPSYNNQPAARVVEPLPAPIPAPIPAPTVRQPQKIQQPVQQIQAQPAPATQTTLPVAPSRKASASSATTGYGTVIEGAPSQIIRNRQLMGTQQSNITNPNLVANPAPKPLEKKDLKEALNRFERNER
jgi:hypothetical protein